MLEQQNEDISAARVAIALIWLAQAATASKMQKHKIQCGLATGIRSWGLHSHLYLYSIIPILPMLDM